MTTTTAPTKTTRLANYIAEGLVAEVGRYGGTGEQGGYVKFRMMFAEDQRAEAEAWAAQFPKSNKVNVTTCSGDDTNFYADRPFGEGSVHVNKVTGEELAKGDADYYTASRWSAPYITVDFRFVANGVTGDKNEAAGKRLRSFLKNLDKLGITYAEKNEMAGALTMDELIARYI